jgi:hypothetical protein
MWAFFSNKEFNSHYKLLGNTVGILTFLILGLSFIVAPAFPRDEQSKSAKEEVKEMVLTPDQMKQYAAAYKDPYILYIRKAINNYLARKLEGNDNYEALEKVDPVYLKNRFIVLSIEDSLMGGREILLISQKKPDKIFYAWVYKAGDTYELRSFDAKELSDEEIKNIRIMYRRFLQDKDLAL